MPNPSHQESRLIRGRGRSYTASPPSGLTIGFSVASRQAIRSGRYAVNTNDRKQMKDDIELNIPPPFNP